MPLTQKKEVVARCLVWVPFEKDLSAVKDVTLELMGGPGANPANSFCLTRNANSEVSCLLNVTFCDLNMTNAPCKVQTSFGEFTLALSSLFCKRSNSAGQELLMRPLRGRSTSDAVWTHGFIAVKGQLYKDLPIIDIIGIDMSSAFNTIQRKPLMKVLENYYYYFF